MGQCGPIARFHAIFTELMSCEGCLDEEIIYSDGIPCSWHPHVVESRLTMFKVEAGGGFFDVEHLTRGDRECSTSLFRT